MSAGIKLPPLPVEDESDLPILQLLERCLNGKATDANWRKLVLYIHEKCSGVVFRVLSSAHRGTKCHVNEAIDQLLCKLVADDCRRLRETSFSHENALIGFLVRAALNKSIDYLASIKSHREVSLPEIDFPAPKYQPEKNLLIDKIYSYLEKEATQVELYIFWLHYCLGYSAREIAEQEDLHRSVREVEYILWKLMKILRSKFGASGGPPHDEDI